MQVGSSTSLAQQLQALENAAQGQYQSSSNFSFLLQATGQSGQSSDSGSSTPSSSSSSSSSSSTTSSSSGGDLQLTGSFTGGALYAVGTGFGSNFVPFSQQQIQGELNTINTARQNAYSSALQNFMTLSQASGQITDTTMTDQVSFTGDNGLVGGNFDTSLSLKRVGGGIPTT